MERALAEYLVNALWQLPVLAAGAWLFVRLTRPGPRLQHGIWLAVLLLAVLLPARSVRRPAGAQVQATFVVTQQGSAIGEEPLPFFARPHDLNLNPTVSRWLVRIYLATLALGLLRVARAWHAAHQLVLHSRETPRHRSELAGLSQRFAVHVPQLRESEEVSSPMVVGVTSPVLLLPEGFVRFAEDGVRAVLCHELAHIKRQDYLMNLVCQLAALPLAWHPVVHEVQQRIRTTREMVCDAIAAEEMESHIGYAKCLLALAQGMIGGQDMARHSQFLGFFSKNTLEERVMRLMETTRVSMRAKVVRAATGAAVMIATGSLAAVFHVTPTMAEQATAAQPPAIVSAAEPTQPQVAAPVSPAPPEADKPADPRHAARARKAGQSEEARQMRERAIIILDDPEFKKRMEDAQRQMGKAHAIMDSPEFKQRMEDAQRQMEKAAAVFNNPEFQRQMQNAQRQMASARIILDDPEFKKSIEDAQRRAAKAAEVFNSPEFKERMEEMKRRAEEDSRRFEEDSRRFEEDSRKFEGPSSPEETAPTP